MRFIMKAWEKNRRRIRFQRNTLLFIRCVIPLLLGLALAEPVLNSNSWLGERDSVFFIIDDGPTTGVRSGSGTIEIDSLKETVLDIASPLVSGSDISMTTTSRRSHDFTPHESHESFIQSINSIKPTTIGPDFNQAIRDARNAFIPGRANTIYLVSPFRNGSTSNIETPEIEWPPNSTLEFTHPSTDEVINIRVDSITPLRRTRLSNTNESPIDTPTKVKIVREGAVLEEMKTSFTVDSGSETRTHEFDWSTGESERTIYIDIPHHQEKSNPTTITLSGEDVLPIDDVRYTTTYTRPSMELIHLRRTNSDTPDWFTIAINPTESVSIETTTMHPGSLQAGDIVDSPMIILSAPELVDDVALDLLGRHVAGGGVLMITPSSTLRTTDSIQKILDHMDVDWPVRNLIEESSEPQSLTTTKGSRTHLEPVANELPELLESTQVFKRLVLDRTRPEDVVLQYTDGIPAITSCEVGPSTGRLVLTTFCLDTTWTNLPTQPVFVPLVQEIVRGSLGGMNGSIEHETGDIFVTTIQNPTHMDFNESIRVPIDPSTGSSIRVIEHPGVWTIQGDATGIETVNINPDLCSTSTMSLQSIQERLGTRWSVVREEETQAGHQNSRFIQPLLFILLSIVVLETILSRIFTTTHPTIQPSQ